jgi:hypothetical protein
MQENPRQRYSKETRVGLLNHVTDPKTTDEKPKPKNKQKRQKTKNSKAKTDEI